MDWTPYKCRVQDCKRTYEKGIEPQKLDRFAHLVHSVPNKFRLSCDFIRSRTRPICSWYLHRRTVVLMALLLGHTISSTHLRLTKIHLRMLLHELSQHILLLLIIARRLPLPLHLLIVHHLLHHPPRLAVQITQLRVFRHDFRGVDLGCRRDDVRPPV
jgi:hypothetical protein